MGNTPLPTVLCASALSSSAGRASSRPAWGASGWMLLLVLTVTAVIASPSEALTFRGCFASGPDDSGGAFLDARVDGLTGALVGTGSWQAANAVKLKQAARAAITDCVANAKKDSISGDEFVFYFVGHGGDNIIADGGEVGEGNGHDNHIRIASLIGGAADRMTDDQLAALLSGFKNSVTVSVILNSCFSHTFLDGANDLPSVTQILNGQNVPIGGHLAVIAASTAAQTNCTVESTDKMIEALTVENGKIKGDANQDGTLTTEELHKFVKTGTFAIGTSLCDEGDSCPATNAPQPGQYEGLLDCGPNDEVCTKVATTPEPGTLVLLLAGVAGIGAGTLRRRGRMSRWGWDSPTVPRVAELMR